MKLHNIFKYADGFDQMATLPRGKAVCVCIIKNDKVLGVARRGTKDQWGLVGGKVEPGEDLKEALVRETKEESGINLNPEKLEPIYMRVDENNYEVFTYLYNSDVNEEPKQGDAGPAAWVTWDDLLDGPFGEYNSQLKKKLESEGKL